MIELNRHIEILLLENECVIVPDFGGFMTHYVAARYDADDQSFIPPLRTLGFNLSVLCADGFHGHFHKLSRYFRAYIFVGHIRALNIEYSLFFFREADFRQNSPVFILAVHYLIIDACFDVQ